MSPTEFKDLTGQLTRQWHFWINFTGVVIEACIATGVIPETGIYHRVGAAIIAIMQTYGYLSAAAWQAPRRAWSEEEKINHFRDAVAEYERKKLGAPWNK